MFERSAAYKLGGDPNRGRCTGKVAVDGAAAIETQAPARCCEIFAGSLGSGAGALCAISAPDTTPTARDSGSKQSIA